MAANSDAEPERPVMTVAHADISESADHIGSFPRKAIAASAIGYAMDGFVALLATIYLLDILATAFLIPEKKGVPLE